MDKKTELYVWILEHWVTKVTMSPPMGVGDKLSVEFWDKDGESFFVEDWHAWTSHRRSKYDADCGLLFSPLSQGLFVVGDPTANTLVTNRCEKADLLERKEELLAELEDIEKEIG